MVIHLLKADKPFFEYEHLLKHAHPERQEKISRLKNDSDKTLSLLSHLFARFEISRLINIPFEEVLFKYNEFGKPYIEKEGVHFSIAHTKNLVAFTLHTAPVGVDIERIVPKNSFPAMRFFTKNEADYVKRDYHRFFEVWTKKEAYVKMLGTGLSTPFSSFDVTNDKLQKMLFSKRFEDYYISICAENINSPVEISLTSMPDLW